MTDGVTMGMPPRSLVSLLMFRPPDVVVGYPSVRIAHTLFVTIPPSPTALPREISATKYETIIVDLMT